MAHADTTLTPLTTDAVDSARALSNDLNGAFLEREDEVRILLTALVAGEHAFLLGPPGTGKSALVSAFSAALGDGEAPFEYLFTKFTDPSEVFGPTDIMALKRGRRRRVTDNRFADCKIAFADEIFKANSAILNALLTALNERQYDNGEGREDIPLEICVGASNELPQDEALGALYDRFLFRRVVQTTKLRASKRALLHGNLSTLEAKLTWDDVRSLRAVAANVDLAPVEGELFALLHALEAKHGITVSDRRLRKLAKALRATAALEGRTAAEPRDLRILADVLWDEPSDRPAIVAEIEEVAGPDPMVAAQKLLDGVRAACSAADPELAAADFLVRAQKANTAVRAALAEIPDEPKFGAVRQAIEDAVRPVRKAITDAMG